VWSGNLKQQRGETKNPVRAKLNKIFNSKVGQKSPRPRARRLHLMRMGRPAAAKHKVAARGLIAKAARARAAAAE
jgi:hypothetical protein